MPYLTYKQALRQALDEELNDNENVIVIGEDVGAYGGAYGVLKGLQEKYGKERVLETPMSESAIVGTAVGAAMTGLVPVVEISSADFAPYSLDSIINQAAKTSYLTNGKAHVPMVIRIPSGISEGSGTTQSQNFESIFASIPGVKVVNPSTPTQAKQLLKASIRDQNPIIFIENKELYDNAELIDETQELEIGKTIVEHEGNDVTIVSWGSALKKVEELITILEREGISVEVVNPLTLSPLDMQPIYDSVIKTSRLVIVQDSPKTGGIGSEIAANIIESDCFNYLDSPIIRVASKDNPIPFNTSLKEEVLPKKEDILDAIYTVTGMK